MPVTGDIGGGLFFSHDAGPSSATLGGLVQNVCIWGIEMGGGHIPVIEVDPVEVIAILEPDQTATMYVTISSMGCANVIYNIDVNFIPTLSTSLQLTQKENKTTLDEWLIVSPLNGIIPPGDFDVISLDFNSVGLMPGEYNAELIITSNDQNNPEIVVPVALTVIEIIEDPVISVYPDFFEFELYPDSLTWGSMQISNFGAGTLDFIRSVEYLDETGPAKGFWLGNETISGSVCAGETIEIDFPVYAIGLEPGTYYANFLIASNDPVTPLVTVPVTLTVSDECPLPPPTSLVAEEIEPLTVFLTWDEPADEFLFYNIYRDSATIARNVMLPQYIDYNVPIGNPEYVVSAVYEECESFSDTLFNFIVTSIAEQAIKTTVLYPNPVTDLVNIRSSHRILKIEILDNPGQSVLSNTVNNNSIQINTSSFAKGIYFVQIETTEGTAIEKLVID